MAGPERIEWRRSAPVRELVRLASYAVGAGLLIAVVWILFGSEPEYLRDGSRNPLADVPTWVAVVAAAGAAGLVVPVLRRPVVAANGYALRLRPGSLRTLTLPWDEVAEIATVRAGGEPLLGVRLRAVAAGLGDRPHGIDQRLLRKLRRADPGRLDRFDLVMRLSDFAGEPRAQLGSLAAFAPVEVIFGDRLR